MSGAEWVREFPGAVTVSDTAGRIIEMNDRSIEAFSADGGASLIGANVYTIQKNGKKKLIYQTPWYKDGVYSGFIELSLEIPWDMAHFNRDK